MIFTRFQVLFFVLPLVVAAIIFRWRRGKHYYRHPLLSYLRPSIPESSFLVHLPRFLEYAALTSLVVALMEPVVPLTEYLAMRESLDIILALDLSSSMQEPMDRNAAWARSRQGISVNEKTRLDAVKEALIGFVQRQKNDRIGLIVFSENAYVVSPLTLDRDYLSRYVQMVDKKTLAGEGLTAIGEAILAAVNLYAHQTRENVRVADLRRSHDKLIILLTDGENNSGRNVYMAIRKAREAGFKIDFIGVEIKWAPESPRLVAAVKETGGNYYDVKDAEQLQKAYRDISLLQKGTWVARQQVAHLPRFYPFALASFALMVVSIALRSIPYFTEIS